MKTKFLKKNGDDLSAVEPIYYQDRFIRVINNRVITICETERKTKSKDENFDEVNFE